MSANGSGGIRVYYSESRAYLLGSTIRPGSLARGRSTTSLPRPSRVRLAYALGLRERRAKPGAIGPSTGAVATGPLTGAVPTGPTGAVATGPSTGAVPTGPSIGAAGTSRPACGTSGEGR